MHVRASLVLLFLVALPAHASFKIEAAFVLSQFGALRTHLEKSDCQGIDQGNWLDCKSDDCIALVFNQAQSCGSWDCKAVVNWDPALCFSDECKAFLTRDGSRCQSNDCRAIVYGKPSLCESPACLWLVKHDQLRCK